MELSRGNMARINRVERNVSWLILAIVTIATRLLTRISYAADPDSLRFAHGLVDFDVAALQPHFPGYPLFIGLAKLLAIPGWDASITFALVGSVATLILIWGFLQLVETELWSPEGMLGALLILLTPMIWLMSVRYMPDLLGTAVAVSAAALLVRRDYQRESLLLLGIAMTGLLAGIRLSYLPLLIIPLLIGLIRAPRKIRAISVLLLSLLLWLVPLILDTGGSALVTAAELQSSGHFTDFGGTIGTIPDLEMRRVALLQGVIADGFGGFWEGRHPMTLMLILGLLALFGRGSWWIFSRDIDGLLTIGVTMVVYTGWILLFQNIVYQPRHVLPLLPFLIAPVWAGARVLLRQGSVGSIATSLLLGLLALVTITLALQQTRPTAIAQVAEYLRDDLPKEGIVSSTGLINWQLAASGVNARFVDVDSHRDSEGSTPDVVVGWFLEESEQGEYEVRRFFHNPYVNRIWPEIPVWRRSADGDE